MPDPKKIRVRDTNGQLLDIDPSDLDAAQKSGAERLYQMNTHDNPKGWWVGEKDVHPALQDGAFLMSPDDFTSNLGKEGTYQMVGPGGKQPVPIKYSMVGSAAKSGYVMDPSSRQKYMIDASADPALKHLKLRPGVQAVGRNTAGQVMVAPDDEEKGLGAQLKQVPGAFGQALAQGAKGFAGLFDPRATEEEKKGGRTSFLENLYPVMLEERLVAPQVQQGQQAVEAAKSGHGALAAGHGLAAVTPFVGPWAAQTGEQVGTSLGEGKYGEAAGTLGGNAALYEAPHLLVKGAKAVPGIVRSSMEDFTKTTPREIAKMAKEATDKNAAAAEAHLPPSAEAAHETQGKEIEYQRQLKEEEENARRKHEDDTKAAENHNAVVRAKAQQKHDAEVRRVRDKNLLVNAKHAEEVKKSQAADADIDRQIQEYKNLESSISDDTHKAFDMDEQERLNAKKIENSKWAAWRAKASQFRGAADALVQAIQKWGVKTSEVRKLLSEVKEDPASASATSAYGMARQSVIDKMNLPGNGPGVYDYGVLNPVQRDFVDANMKRLGIQPPSVSLNLQPGGTVTLDEVHRAKSVLRRHSIEMRRANQTVEAGEAAQLADILEDTEAQWSKQAGVFNEWMDARAETVAYNEAFGREFNDPRTTLSELEKQTNPDFIKERESEERLSQIEQRNPQLAAEHRRIRAKRERLAKMQTPDTLEKKRVQPPDKPSIGDLRPGYALENDQITYEPPSVGDLRPGHALKEPPQPPEGGFEAHAKRTVPEVTRDLGPDRPEDIQIPDEDIQARKKAHITSRAETLREHGVRRALYAALTSIPLAVAFEFLKAGSASGPETLAAGVGSGIAVFKGAHAMANLLERQSVVNWLSKVTERDAAAWEKLPPDQKALFKGDMQALLDAADKKKVSVSPYLRGFVSGVVGSQPQSSLDDLRKEAEKRKPQQQAAPGPQSSAEKPVWTHEYDPERGIITAVNA